MEAATVDGEMAQVVSAMEEVMVLAVEEEQEVVVVVVSVVKVGQEGVVLAV